MSDIQITTLPDLGEGVELKRLGPVLVNVIRATHGGKDVIAKFKDLFGGRVGAIEGLVDMAQTDALRDAKLKVAELGGDVLLDLKFEYTSLGEKNGLVGVHLQGTAAKELKANRSSKAPILNNAQSTLKGSAKKTASEGSDKISFGAYHANQEKNESLGNNSLGNFDKRL